MQISIMENKRDNKSHKTTQNINNKKVAHLYTYI